MYIDTGLTDSEVNERTAKGQTNTGIDVETKSIKRIISDNLFTLFNLVNCIMAFSIAMVHSYKNMMFIGVAVWNAAIGIFQEIRSKKTIDKMSIISQPKIKVMRNGKIQEINAKDVVLKDLLVLKSGNQICADSVVLAGECDVDESMLTGESDSVHKQPGDEILSGSFIISGSVKAEVKRVGKDNYVGKITEKVKYLKKNQSEMMKSVKFIIKFVSICIVPLAAILLYNQITIPGNGFDDAIVNTVAALIGTMPSGLVLLTTIVMEVSVIKLAGHKTLVQDMYCIETLARVDMLCLDKTGTITEGKLEVEKTELLSDITDKELEKILGSYVKAMEDDNATMLAIGEKYGDIAGEEVIAPYKVTPFSSERKWSMVSFKEYGTCAVGAAEFIPAADADKFKNTVDEYAKQGYRVLVVAFSDKGAVEEAPDDLRCIALCVIRDKVRKSARATLEYFDSQDVDIKIISGDSPETVMKVAEDAGVKNHKLAISTAGMTDEELRDAVEKYTVFGRVTPDQKLKIVEILKENGHTVGMIGDGVNDVMALKEADCSVGMQSGSDAVRNISQMVLLESDFEVMPQIVAEGRKTINNIERSATLYLVKTIYSFVLAVVFAIISIPYPFSPIQLTLIGAMAIGIPSFILAMEPNYDRVDGGFLRNVLQDAVPGAMGIIANVIMAIIIAKSVNASPVERSTLAAYLTAIASMVVLYDLCIPFNWFRRTMFTILTVILIFAFKLFKPLFCVTTIKWELVVVIVAVGTATFLLHKFFVTLMERILEKF